MIAEQLKRSVLQAAIQGKLTQQLPEDGDASDLVRDIQKEKTRLFKEGQIKRTDPLLEITEDEIPFDIPDNWCWIRLKSITSVLGDGIHGTPNYTLTGEYSFINGNNLNDGKILIKNDTKKVTEEEYRKYQKTLDETTVLVSINGTIGNVAFYNGEKIILGKSACYFNLLGNISKSYMKLLLNSNYFIEYAYNKATGSTIKNVSLQAMRDFPVPLPPLTEQNRIVECLYEVLPEIGQLETSECKLDVLQRAFPKKMKDSILQYAVEGKLTEQLPSDGDARDLLKKIQQDKARLIKEGKIRKEKPLPEIAEDEISFDIPENWIWARLNDLAFLEDGVKLRGHRFIILEAKYLRGRISGNMTTSGKFVRKGERVILVDGENSGEVFAVPQDGYMGSTFKKLTVISEDVWLFLGFFLKKQQELLKNNKRGAAIPHLDKKLFREMLVPLPPINEQKRIVDRLNKLLPICESLAPEVLARETVKKLTICVQPI